MTRRNARKTPGRPRLEKLRKLRGLRRKKEAPTPALLPERSPEAPAPSDLDGLAAAARECPALALAHRFADWVGEGRTVETRPVLHPIQAATATRTVGAPDSVDLGVVWTFAQHAGFIEVSGDRTFAGPMLQAWQDSSPRAVLHLWRETYERYTGLAIDDSTEPYVKPAAFGAQAALRLLVRRDQAIDATELASKVATVLEFAQRSITPGLLEPKRDALAGLQLLLEFGAASRADDRVIATPLGRWLHDAINDPHASARRLVDHVVVGGIDAEQGLVRRWLDARSSEQAARELLEVAAHSDPTNRAIAIDVVRRLGREVEPVWRRWVEDPWVGPHARVWLSKHLAGVAPSRDDSDWALVDRLAGALGQDGSPEARAIVRRHCIERLGDDVLERLGAVRHPDLDLVIAVLEESPTPMGCYRLHIELREVYDPVVWRQVLVPADSTLRGLHKVIVTTMGWDDRHDHRFVIDGKSYSSGAPGLDQNLAYDESRIRLCDVASQGSAFEYEYDELDRWQHVITVEAVLDQPVGIEPPRCLDGAGACPPEDCGGAFGYQRLRAALSDPDSPEAERAMEFFDIHEPDEFDPYDFSTSLPNALLAIDRSHGKAA